MKSSPDNQYFICENQKKRVLNFRTFAVISDFSAGEVEEWKTRQGERSEENVSTYGGERTEEISGGQTKNQHACEES